MFKPKGTLKAEDKYQTKIELAAEIITELINEGFNINLVLADSLYGESSQFLKQLTEYNLSYVVAITSNHAVWLPADQSVRANKWYASRLKSGNPPTALARKFERTFSDGKSENRYIREIVYGKKRAKTYWEITTDPETMPENSTTFVMTNLQGNLKKKLGDLYGLRTWVEYGFRQCKQELGWTDYRFTNFPDIERWWEIIFCVYTMISLNSSAFLASEKSEKSAQIETKIQKSNSVAFSNHQQWNHASGWKNVLNNLRLVVQPLLLFWLVSPWLDIFPNSNLLLGFNYLISRMNQFKPFYSSG